jgi:2',3'-cyclic-nucleotide 2'-phosphodiesterase (5'-nucleotidase family)
VTIIIVLTGMVEVLNAAGLDYVCWGNHESDVPFYSMLDRIRESK